MLSNATGGPIKQSAKVVGGATKGRAKRALRAALAMRRAPRNPATGEWSAVYPERPTRGTRRPLCCQPHLDEALERRHVDVDEEQRGAEAQRCGGSIQVVPSPAEKAGVSALRSDRRAYQAMGRFNRRAGQAMGGVNRRAGQAMGRVNRRAGQGTGKTGTSQSTGHGSVSSTMLNPRPWRI